MAMPDLGPLLRELAAVTPLTRDVFDSATAERRLCDYFAVATMDGFGALSRLEATAAAACVTYVERTQVGKRPPLSPPSREAAGTTMAIDPATRANLELTRTLSGERRGSLLDAIDCTVTAAGSRLLAQRLAAPLTDAPRSRGGSMPSRLSSTDAPARDDFRTTLRGAPDMARALARLSVGRGGPRDLAAIARRHRCAADPALARLAALDRAAARSARCAWMRCAGPRATLARANSHARSPTSCRCSSATAASSARATTRRSTRRAVCATNRAASSPRCRRAMPTTPASRR